MKGVQIKDFINRIGIKSQEELADRLGVSNQTVSNWVKGKTYPTHQTEEQLLEMGITVEELFGKAYPSSVAELNPKGHMEQVVNDSLKSMLEKAGFHFNNMKEKENAES